VKLPIRFAILLALLAASLGSAATYGSPTSITGTVTELVVYANMTQTFIFQMSVQPSTGCSNNGFFEISPSTVTDAATRSMLLSTLFTAKATGAALAVTFDTGTYCDTMGFPAVYGLYLLP
jgi:hypothetical protein